MYEIHYNLDLADGRSVKHIETMYEQRDLSIKALTSRLIKKLMDSDYFYYTREDGISMGVNMQHVVIASITIKDKEKEAL